MQLDKSYVVDFFQFFMEYILPYEVKYTTLRKKKSYELHREIMEELLFNFNDELNHEIFVKILERLEEIALKVQRNYYNELTAFFQDKITSNALIMSLEEIKSEGCDYIEAIKIVETDLGLEKISVDSIPIEDVELHIADTIYNREYKKLNASLKDFREAFNHLNNNIEETKEKITINIFSDSEFNKKVTTKEYLQYVVFNEAWNFLSHIAHAVGSFSTPKVYISNIEKGISHLRRAVLDIYDGLILETKEIDEGYLQIRAVKLNSLGSDKKISNLSNELKNYYLKLQ